RDRPARGHAPHRNHPHTFRVPVFDAAARPFLAPARRHAACPRRLRAGRARPPEAAQRGRGGRRTVDCMTTREGGRKAATMTNERDGTEGSADTALNVRLWTRVNAEHTDAVAVQKWEK